jgi:hypothetical protein
MDPRADLDVEDLLKIILVLVIVWMALQIITETMGTIGSLLGPFQPVFGLLIVVLIVLYLLDRI